MVGSTQTQLPVFCISLTRAHERRAAFVGQARSLGVEFEWVDAVDAAAQPPGWLGRWYDAERAQARLGRQLAPAEVACSLSHQRVYQRLLEMDAPAGIVLEDDVQLMSAFPDVLRSLGGLPRRFMSTPWIGHLGGNEGFEDRPLLLGRRSAVSVGKRHSLRPVLRGHLALQRSCAYLVTRAAARSVQAREVPVTVPADAWGPYVESGSLGALYAVRPVAAAHAADDPHSSIQTAANELRAGGRHSRLPAPLRGIRQRGRRALQRQLYRAIGPWV